jgi:capsular exopolysaccharide synthesis family protein
MRLLLRLADARGDLETWDLKMKAMKDKPPEIDRILEDLLDADQETKDLRKRLRVVQDVVDDYVEKGAGSDPSALWYRSRLGKLQEQLKERRRQLLARARRSAPDGREAREQAEVTRAQLRKRVDQLVNVRDQLQGQIKDLARQAARTPVLAEEYDTVKEAIQRDEKVLADLSGQLERQKLQLRADSRISRFQDAELMKKDVKKQVLGTAVAPLVVLFGVCMALAYLDHRQRRVRTAAQVSRGLGIRVVGAVPDRPHLEREVAGAAEGDLGAETVLESIDAIRTLLLHEAHGQSTRLVMVTSASAGEGKTTLASHLAGSLARAGRKTLLVDCDLRRPALHELFELPVQPGFSEVVLGEVEVADAVQETDLDNLWLVPAGQWDREVVHALARDGLEGVFEKLREEFDFIVIDSHPVLSAADSLLIGRQVDAVLLSVLREVSQMPRVYAAAQQLTAVGIRVLGAVVNGTSPEDVFTSPVAAPAA